MTSRRKRPRATVTPQVIHDLLELPPVIACCACGTEPALELFPRVMITCRLCDAPVHLECASMSIMCPTCASSRMLQCRCCGGFGVEKAQQMERWCPCSCGKSLVHESCARTSLCPDCMPNRKDSWLDEVYRWKCSDPMLSVFCTKPLSAIEIASKHGLGALSIGLHENCMEYAGCADGVYNIRNVWRRNPRLPRLIVVRASEVPVPGTVSLFRTQWCTDPVSDTEQLFLLVVTSSAKWGLVPMSHAVKAGTMSILPVMEITCLGPEDEASSSLQSPSQEAPASVT